MQNMVIRTNTRTKEHFDKNGISFRNNTPEISIGSKFILEWYLYTETADADSESPDISSWVSDTNLSGYSAIVTADDDFIHAVSGTLVSPIIENEPFPEMIQIKIDGAKSKNIAKSGKATFYNASREFQTILYSDVIISDDSVYIQVQGTAKYSFETGSEANVSQEVYIRSMNIAELSEPEKGKFVFEISTNSAKLNKAIQTLNSKTLSIKGIELMPFTADAETGEYIQAPAYLVDTAVLISTIGDPIINAESSDVVKSEIAEFVSSMVKSKIAVSFSELKNGKIAISGKMNPPIGLVTDKGNYYPIEKGTLTAVSGGWELEPSVYLAYDNSAEFGGVWTVYLGSDVSGGSGGGSSGGVTQEQLDEALSGMDISEAESATIPLVHNSVVKYSFTTDDVISVDTSTMTADKSATMELWLTMPETVVSFSIPDVTWIEEPSFDTANMLYCVVLRWDGEKVLANVAYSVEVS